MSLYARLATEVSLVTDTGLSLSDIRGEKQHSVVRVQPTPMSERVAAVPRRAAAGVSAALSVASVVVPSTPAAAMAPLLLGGAAVFAAAGLYDTDERVQRESIVNPGLEDDTVRRMAIIHDEREREKERQRERQRREAQGGG